MTAYKDGERKNDTMKALIDAYHERQPRQHRIVLRAAKACAGANFCTRRPGAGKALATPCAACHGAEGVSGYPPSPSLAGQDAQYLAATPHEYKDGGRSDTTMKAMAARPR